jgi:hypothetical protein
VPIVLGELAFVSTTGNGNWSTRQVVVGASDVEVSDALKPEERKGWGCVQTGHGVSVVVGVETETYIGCCQAQNCCEQSN